MNKPFVTFIACVALSLGLVGCGSGGYSKPKTPPGQPGTMPPPVYPPGSSSSGANSSLNRSAQAAPTASANGISIHASPVQGRVAR